MKNTLLLITVFLTFNALAQKSKNEFKGDRYYQEYSFDKAIAAYTSAPKLTTAGQRKLADSYQKIGNNFASEQVYAAFINSTEIIPDDLYNYAFVLRLNAKYEESDTWMKKFQQLVPTDSRAIDYVSNSIQRSKLIKDTGKYKVTNLEMNTSQQDFGPAFYNSQIVFASSREEGKAIKRYYNWNQQPFLDLYIADTNGYQLSNLRPLNRKLNNSMHEGPATYTADGKLMAFTRNNYSGKSKDGIVKLQLFFAEADNNGSWRRETAFKLNNTEYSVGHPCLSKDGKEMYFSSDMPGGKGGVDIYHIVKNQDGAWGEPVNLGTVINTEGDEMFPFYQEEQKILFFASNGHMGLGGLDVFASKTTDKGQYVKAVNMGAPVNSQFDDFALIVDDKLQKGYFSSNRTTGHGDDDIYAVEMLKPMLFGKLIKGITKSSKGNILSGVKVSLLDDSGKAIQSTITDETGKYAFAIDADKNFAIYGTNPHYLDKIVPVSPETSRDEIIVDLVLDSNHASALVGIISDYISKQPVQGVKVSITDNTNGKLISEYTTTANGEFRDPLMGKNIGDKIDYTMRLKKEDYLNKTVVLKLAITKAGEINVNETINLNVGKLEIGGDLAKLVNIAPIYFDIGKYEIRKDAISELNKIIAVLNEYPNMEIELGSHTDCRSGAAYNLNLSSSRAKATADYIKNHIDKPGRVHSKGYGESKLINNCACEGATLSTCSEEEHQKNRRTEFVITKIK